MNKKLLLFWATITCLGINVCNVYAIDVFLSSAPSQVYFSPQGGCTEAIVNTIDQAKQSIFVQAYSFTSQPIAYALIRAHNRKTNVIIIVDKSQLTAKSSKLPNVKGAGIETYVDKVHSIAHNKIIIIDEHIVINGSFNFTAAAEYKNAENLLIVDSKELARQYLNNFLMHKSHAIKYDQ